MRKLRQIIGLESMLEEISEYGSNIDKFVVIWSCLKEHKLLSDEDRFCELFGIKSHEVLDFVVCRIRRIEIIDWCYLSGARETVPEFCQKCFNGNMCSKCNVDGINIPMLVKLFMNKDFEILDYVLSKGYDNWLKHGNIVYGNIDEYYWRDMDLYLKLTHFTIYCIFYCGYESAYSDSIWWGLGRISNTEEKFEFYVRPRIEFLSACFFFGIMGGHESAVKLFMEEDIFTEMMSRGDYMENVRDRVVRSLCRKFKDIENVIEKKRYSDGKLGEFMDSFFMNFNDFVGFFHRFDIANWNFDEYPVDCDSWKLKLEEDREFMIENVLRKYGYREGDWNWYWDADMSDSSE